MTGSAEFQLTGRLWSMVERPEALKNPATYWAPPGPATASAEWRLEKPAIGDYEISIRYGNAGNEKKLAKNANYVVYFRGVVKPFLWTKTEIRRSGSFWDASKIRPL